MKFRRVNDTTINCIITEDDLRENGLVFQDLFSRRKEVLAFIRSVIAQAVSSEKMSFTGERIAMRLSILPDRSISLTVSDQTDDMIPEGLFGAELRETDTDSDRNDSGTDNGFEAQKEYLIRFGELLKAVQYSHTMPPENMPPSSLYYDEENREYLLCIRGTEDEGTAFERTVLSANEFGVLQTVSSGSLAHVREHCRPVLEEDALQQLRAL